MTERNEYSHAHVRTALYTWLALGLALFPYIRIYIHTEKTISPYPPPQLHFFTAPKPFSGEERKSQLRALRSWLSISPRPRVTFFGNATGISHVAHAYNLRHEPQIDTTFLGIPILPSILSNVHKLSSTCDNCITIFLNADIIVFDDLIEALSKLSASYQSGWLAVAARWDIDKLPFNADAKYAREVARLHTYGGIDLWAWDSASGALFDEFIPPFVLGRGKYDNWLTHEIITKGNRKVVDISHACTLIHEKHDYHLITRDGIIDLDEQAGHSSQQGKTEYWSTATRSKFELYINSYLATHHGSYTNQEGTIFHTPFMLMKCYNEDGLCLIQRRRPHTCRCEYSPFVQDAQNDPYTLQDSRIIFCGMLSQSYGRDSRLEKRRWRISGHSDKKTSLSAESSDHSPKSFGLPLTLSHLLKVPQDQSELRTVILVVGDFSDRFLITELVCSMRKSKIFSGLIVAALDDQLYEYCIVRGMPVYLIGEIHGIIANPSNKKEASRFQEMATILKLGFNVLSVQPGCTFSLSPWHYVSNHIGEAKFGLLPFPSADNTTDITTHLSNDITIASDIIFVRSHKNSISLIDGIGRKLRKKNAGTERYLKSLACSGNLNHMNKPCTGLVSEVHLLRTDMFKNLDSDICPKCLHSVEPILFYISGHQSANFADDALKQMDNALLLRSDPRTGICDYS